MTERVLCAIEILIIAAVLFVALGLQLFAGEEPCSLCLLQRLFMLGVASSIALNLRFGSAKRHYALAILSALLGSLIALRQIALHVCPQFSTFGVPFWGLSLYTWSCIIFAVSIAYNALLLLIFRDTKKRKMIWLDHVALIAVLIVALLNIWATYHLCGLTPCGG